VQGSPSPPLSSHSPSSLISFRPPNSLELREGGDIVVDFPQDDDGTRTTVKLKNAPPTGPEANGFNFDKAFPMGTEQQDVFEFGIKETVDGGYRVPMI